MTALQKIEWLKGERLIGRFRCQDEGEDQDLSTLLNQIEILLKKKSIPKYSESFEKNYIAFITHFNDLKGWETGTKGKFKGESKSKRQFKALHNEHSNKDIVKAIKAMFNNQHHIDTKYVYVTPEFATRPAIFARFLEISNS